MAPNHAKKTNYFSAPGVEITSNSIIYILKSFLGFSFLHKSRKREIVEARQLAMFIIKNKTKLSLHLIGVNCGGKDHATVLHACKTINNLIDTQDKVFIKKYKSIFESFDIPLIKTK